MLLNNIYLQNFKCFKEQSISLGPLTLLAGVNGMGKSSVMQALLTARQSYLLGVGEDDLVYKGPLINLGTIEDLRYENAMNDDVCITVVGHDSALKKVDNAHFRTFAKGTGQKNHPLSLHTKEHLECSLFADSFAYLQAERMGPRTSLPMPHGEQLRLNRIGNAGEYCTHILYHNESVPVPHEALRIQRPNDDIILPGLRSQTEIWLSKIGQSARIHVTQYPGMDILNLEFSFILNGLPTKNYRSTNVGFGLSYALPIFVAVLSAQPGSLILIENPEAHLHPKGQTMMGHFLALAASCGIQIIVETHSDHLLNGVRLAVKQRILQAEHTVINFFERSNNAGTTSVVCPKLDKHGRLSFWPEDFFDEWEKNLAELL